MRRVLLLSRTPTSCSSTVCGRCCSAPTPEPSEPRLRPAQVQNLVQNQIRPAQLDLIDPPNIPDVVSVLERLRLDPSRLEEAVLIGCSEQNRVQFCLDLGENREVKTADS